MRMSGRFMDIIMLVFMTVCSSSSRYPSKREREKKQGYQIWKDRWFMFSWCYLSTSGTYIHTHTRHSHLYPNPLLLSSSSDRLPSFLPRVQCCGAPRIWMGYTVCIYERNPSLSDVLPPFTLWVTEGQQQSIIHVSASVPCRVYTSMEA